MERKIVFVLGGPGSGKGTQCSKIASTFGFCHLSVGEVLEREVQRGTENGPMITAFKKEGKLVPSELVVKLLQRAMEEEEAEHQADKFLIDGFPRSEENRIAADRYIKIEPEFVLYLDCSEEVMVRRLLSRNQGRVDDNVETIPKRVRSFVELTLPVVNYYSSVGKVQKINGDRPIDEVFEDVKLLLTKF